MKYLWQLKSYWANQLYTTVQNPYTEVMPPLNSDIDGNNIPDGYHLNPVYYDSRLDTTDGAPVAENYSIKINKVGRMTTIPDLGGIEKGEKTHIEIWTKGSEGSFITVSLKLDLKFPGINFQQRIKNGQNTIFHKA